MRIYQPSRGVGTAQSADSFIIIDDAGVEIGQGGLDYRVLRKSAGDRPLEIEMIINAHPAAADTLYGALLARAVNIKSENGSLPAHLFVRCALNDLVRHDYFMNLGFDDRDGLELFVQKIAGLSRRRNYPPIGTQCVDVDLHTRSRREEFLRRLQDLGDEPHAEEWLSDRMRGQVFIAKAVYYGSDLCGLCLVTGSQQEAVLNMIGVEPKWRGKGVAAALLDETDQQLARQQVPYLIARAPRRNRQVLRVFQRTGFEWVRTEELLLGKDM